MPKDDNKTTKRISQPKPRIRKPKKKPTEKNKGGAPTKYTLELADRICEGISRKVPLAKLCDNDDSLPAPRTVYRWLREFPEFCQNYEKAKEDQADFLVDEALEISDDDTIDPAHKRIMVDTRKWVASKFKAKKYGDKIQQEISGSLNLTDLSDDELDLKIKMLLKDN